MALLTTRLAELATMKVPILRMAWPNAVMVTSSTTL